MNQHTTSAPYRRAVAVAAAVAVGGLALSGLAAPASAATATFPDAARDMAHGADIHQVRVTHNKQVRVTVTHRNLRRSFRSGSSVAVYLDTVPSESGPEFALLGGTFQGSDYALVRTNGWRPRHSSRLTCSHELSLDYTAETAKVRIARSCLGDPKRIRVAVKTGGEQQDGDIVRDWLGERRELTPFVRRG